MEDLFKKFIYAGVGFVSRTNDRVQDTINQLVSENKLSQKEGEKILKSLQANTDTKRKEFETQINSIAKRVMKGMGVASNEDVEDLKRAVKGSGGKTAAASKPAATKSGTAGSTGSARKAPGTTGTASKAKTAATGTAKAAGAASTAAKKSAAGSKGGSAAAKKPTTSASTAQGGTTSGNA